MEYEPLASLNAKAEGSTAAIVEGETGASPALHVAMNTARTTTRIDHFVAGLRPFATRCQDPLSTVLPPQRGRSS
jgi:hypothetical protein